MNKYFIEFVFKLKKNYISAYHMMGSKDFAEVYGILMLDGPLANLCARAIVVLDENDMVIYTELVPEITKEPNYTEALKHFFKE